MLLNQSETIKKIESLGGQYATFSDLSLQDQLLACEVTSEATPIKEVYHPKNEETNDNTVVNGLVIGSCKRKIDFELTPRKLEIVAELKGLHHLTPPIKIAQLLEEFFNDCGTIPGWWLAVAQQWCPRTIYWNINYLVRQINGGWLSLQNPAPYFTQTIQYRKKRKKFRATNGSR